MYDDTLENIDENTIISGVIQTSTIILESSIDGMVNIKNILDINKLDKYDDTKFFPLRESSVNDNSTLTSTVGGFSQSFKIYGKLITDISTEIIESRLSEKKR